MAATRYIGTADTGNSMVNSSVVGAASGGTLAGSQKVQVVFDDTVFTSTQEGKQRLLAALDIIRARIASTKVWPIAATS